MNKLVEQMEKDQTEVIDRTSNIKSLADEVKRLRSMEDQIKNMEETLKNKKKDLERVSGEVIPTLLSEMGLSSLKLADGSAVDVRPYYSATISIANRGYQPTQKLKVEPMTLKALVRERIEAGKEMPTDIFNVFVGNRTKITRKQ